MDNSKNSNMGTQTWLDVFIENLNLLIKENNLNKNKLAKECEVPYQTLSSWYGKKITRIRINVNNLVVVQHQHGYTTTNQ